MMMTLLLSEPTPSGSQIWKKETQNRCVLFRDSLLTLLIYSVLFQIIFKIWSMRRIYQCLYSIGGRTLGRRRNKFMRQVYNCFVSGTNMAKPWEKYRFNVFTLEKVNLILLLLFMLCPYQHLCSTWTEWWTCYVTWDVCSRVSRFWQADFQCLTFRFSWITYFSRRHDISSCGNQKENASFLAEVSLYMKSFLAELSLV